MMGIGRLTARILGAGVLVLALLGCEGPDPLKYSKWEPITDQESMLALSSEAALKFPDITRRIRHNASRIQEVWRWNGGRLLVVDLYPGGYFSSTFTRPEMLKERAKVWPQLKRLGLTVKDEDIKYGVNRLGKFIYSVSSSSDDTKRCLLYQQPLRDTEAGDSPAGADASGGYLFGYHCTQGSGTTALELETTTLSYLKSVTRRK